MAQLSIQREIDLMITTANHYIDYMNKKIHYGQFVELAMREFAKSQVNQNLSYVQNWLQPADKSRPYTVRSIISQLGEQQFTTIGLIAIGVQ